MFYELRQYRIYPGKMDEWLEVMEGEIIPFQIECGMHISGSFRGESDDCVYVWMRRFESEEQREVLYQRVYDSELWKNDIGPRIGKLIDRDAIEVTRIVPTSLSAMK